MKRQPVISQVLFLANVFSGVTPTKAKVLQQDSSHVTIPSVDSVILPQQPSATLIK